MKKPIAVALIAATCSAALATATTSVKPARHQAVFGTCQATDETVIPKALFAAAAAGKLTQRTTEPDADYYRRIAPFVAKVNHVRISFGILGNPQIYDPITNTYSIPPDRLLTWLKPIDGYPSNDHQIWLAKFGDAYHAPVRTYSTQNVFGAKFRVTKADRATVSFVFATMAESNQPATVTFKNPWPNPDTGIFHIVIEGDISAPYIVSDESRKTPTFYDRTNATATTIGIAFTPICGSVVELLSGKVVARFDPAVIGVLTDH